MTPARHARIQAIFEAAIELPDPQRPGFIEGECRGDSDLRLRVTRLIEAAGDTVTCDLPPLRVVKECPSCSRCFESPIAICPHDGSELSVAFPGPLLIDGKYRIEKRLGSGGMGSVFLARHIGLEKNFALKLINTGGPIPASYRTRFEQEALALGRLKHPNIVDVTDFGIDSRDGGLPYLVMEYVEGGTLRQFTRNSIPAVPKTLELLREIAAGVDAAHSKDIVHGDLKPANVLLGDPVKIVDFGLARPAGDSDRPGERAIRGTPAYMSPELVRGEPASKATDRFAFGVLAYEMLTGQAPFGRQIAEVQKNQRQPAAPPSRSNPDLPAEIDAPVLALLKANPDDRPGSASIAVAELEAAWIASLQRCWRARELLPRTAIATAIALLTVLLAWCCASLGVFKTIEERTMDWRFAALPSHPPDPRLLVVSIDDATLARDPRPLASRDADLARMIEHLFAGGAQAVAIDILLPNWGESPAFGKAVQLHAPRLTLAKFSSGNDVIGPECIGPLTAAVLGPERYNALFGFVNLEPDEDRKIRRAQLTFADQTGNAAPSFAERAVEAAGFGRGASAATWIDYSVKARDIPVMSWTAAALDQGSSIFRAKLIIIGANYAGSGDFHRVPDESARQLVPGAIVQALIANSVVENFQVSGTKLSRDLFAMAVGSLSIVWLALMLPHRPMWSRAAAAAVFVGWLAFAFLIFRARLTLVAITAPEIAIALSAIAAWVIPGRLAAYPETVA